MQEMQQNQTKNIYDKSFPLVATQTPFNHEARMGIVGASMYFDKNVLDAVYVRAGLWKVRTRAPGECSLHTRVKLPHERVLQETGRVSPRPGADCGCPPPGDQRRG